MLYLDNLSFDGSEIMLDNQENLDPEELKEVKKIQNRLFDDFEILSEEPEIKKMPKRDW